MSDFLVETLTLLKTPWEEWPPEAKRRKRELDALAKGRQLKNRVSQVDLNKLITLKEQLNGN